MRRWSTLFALATIFSVTLLTTNTLQAQDKTEKTSRSKKKKDAEPAATPAPAAPSTKGSPAKSAGVSDSDIARAQSSGMVWVNTDSGVYHKPGTRWYGNTKRGEYMTQKQAQEKGYRPAYGKVCL